MDKKVSAFDSNLYLQLQVKAIKDRVKINRAKKVYIEFGGKIFDDLHALRVLPGYFPDMKLRIIKNYLMIPKLFLLFRQRIFSEKRIRGDHK